MLKITLRWTSIPSPLLWFTIGKNRLLFAFYYNRGYFNVYFQGLDVLEIMRNIHVFVSRYLYNLNNQVRFLTLQLTKKQRRIKI